MSKKSNDLEHIELFYLYGIHIPTNTIYLGNEVTEEENIGLNTTTAERFLKSLHLLSNTTKEPITIIMNNIGGEVDQGLAIYDAIKSCKNHVTITIKGNCYSASAYILQAADERVMSPNSSLMFHAGEEGHGHNHPKILKKWFEYNDKMGKILNNILFEKINEKRTKTNQALMSKATFDKMNDFDTILMPQEALDLGLIDRIE